MTDSTSRHNYKENKGPMMTTSTNGVLICTSRAFGQSRRPKPQSRLERTPQWFNIHPKTISFIPPPQSSTGHNRGLRPKVTSEVHQQAALLHTNHKVRSALEVVFPRPLMSTDCEIYFIHCVLRCASAVFAEVQGISQYHFNSDHSVSSGTG